MNKKSSATVSGTLRSLMAGACIYYTILSVGLILLNFLLGGSTENRIDVVKFLLLFPCGLAFSGARLTRKSQTLPEWSRRLLHYLIIILAFFLFLWLPSGSSGNALRSLTAILLISVLYWVAFLTAVLVKKRFQSFKEE